MGPIDKWETCIDSLLPEQNRSIQLAFYAGGGYMLQEAMSISQRLFETNPHQARRLIKYSFLGYYIFRRIPREQLRY